MMKFLRLPLPLRLRSRALVLLLACACAGPTLLACSSAPGTPDAPDAAANTNADAQAPGVDAQASDADAQAADPRIAQLVSAASAAVQQTGVIGIGIAVVVNGKLAYAGGVGLRSLGGPPVDGDTLFIAGSATKMFTAATVMSLVDDGKLDLQVPVTTYLPRLSVESPFDVQQMTLSRLLSHTDGLEDTNGTQCSLARFSDYGANGPVTLWGVPGTYWDYSNNDYALAAQAIESIVGAGGYEQAVHDRVFSPAGMATATLDPVAAALSGNVVTGYVADATGALTQPVSVVQATAACPYLLPAGFALVSAHDFGQFVATMLAAGGTMLKPQAVTQMETGLMATGDHPNDNETYGYALFVEDYGGQTVIQHTGDLPGFHSLIMWVPTASFGLAMMVNTDTAALDDVVGKTALTLFAPPPMTPAPPILTTPSQWTAYAGSYLDSYGMLGEFSIAVQDAGLVANRPDGGALGTLTQIDGDFWGLMPSSGGTGPTGVFWRDDAGAVQQIVTREGVAARLDAGAVSDADVGD